MNCSVCETWNEVSHKFCSECGAALVSVCAACGHENPPAHKFCSECGIAVGAATARGDTVAAQELRSSPGSATEERRLVTSLFVDLVGFTSFSDSRDPEEVRAVLTRYFDRARGVIERFGGVVDKYIGDAITAFWGTTVANDDDAERAVRAALELVDTVAELGSQLGGAGLGAAGGRPDRRDSRGTGRQREGSRPR